MLEDGSSLMGTFLLVGFGLVVVLGSMAMLILARRYQTPKAVPNTRVTDWNLSPRRYWLDALNEPEAFDEAAIRLYGRAVLNLEIEEASRLARSIRTPEPTPTARVVDVPVPSVTAVQVDQPLHVVMDDTVETLDGLVAESSAPNGVFFKDGEPRLLSEYGGQEHVVSYLQAVVDGTPAASRVPREHQLFLGPAGLGKTLLAKCFANTLAERNRRLGLGPVWFQEEFPADIPDLKALDRVIRRAAQRPTMLFIDEIHDLKTEGHALKLYLLMEEGRYKFEGAIEPVLLPNICIAAATTDSGALHPALQRRFNRHALQPLSREQIAAAVETRSFAIMPEATAAIVERTHFTGAPWEALQLYQQCIQFARQRQSTAVAIEDVRKVFESQQIDDLGLRWMDRAVIKVLLRQPRFRNLRGASGREFVCFAASENDVCSMAQIDKGEYRDSIKPRLMSRGLLTVRPTYGQALQPAAALTYSWLIPDFSQPA